MADIFLSYARENKDRAEVYAEAFAALGWTVFWDPRILAGSSWDEVIESELNASKCVVVLWSAESVKSTWVKNEASVGEERNILVPVSIDEVSIPLAFRHRQSAQLQEWSGDTGEDAFVHLLESITHHVRPSGTVEGDHTRTRETDDARTFPGTEQQTAPQRARPPLSPEIDALLRELEDSATTHQRRADIGDRLAALGDPRSGVGVGPDGTPDIVWCEIPAGRVDIRGHGAFPVDRFSIATHLVTYAQYQAFLQDEHGYENSSLWKGLDRRGPPGEQFRPTANCPAENVSWFDAMAFCRWLDGKLRASGALGEGDRIRLPTEWEWQHAASGARPKSDYPWNPAAWDGSRANTTESSLRRTTAVGMYPPGASSQGAFDLLGNVWEWCSNPYEKPKNPGGKRDARVVRGGSWRDNADGACASYRGGSLPVFRSLYIGFRVVCVSSRTS